MDSRKRELRDCRNSKKGYIMYFDGTEPLPEDQLEDDEGWE